MTLATHFDILAAAAGAGQFAFDGGASQVWVDIVVSAVEGLATLPIAMAIVWVVHRARIDRWTLLSAILATLFSIMFVALLQIIGLNFWAFVAQVLSEMEFGRFFYELWPAISVIFVGSLMFAYWLKKRLQRDDAKVYL